MIYKQFKDKKLSALGFGTMRLPLIDGDDSKVDEAKAAEMFDYAIKNGVNYFDTARGYTDSEEKLGEAFDGMRDMVYIATKTGATTVEGFWKDLETSLGNLRTDYVDLYQFHNPAFCPVPGDESGIYDAMIEAKAKGMVTHIGITNHRLNVAKQAIESGLYETLQFPFCYIYTKLDLP